MTSEMRSLVDPCDKAVYVLTNYNGDVNLSRTVICEYFKISRNSMKKRLWSNSIGHKDHDTKQPRYLASCHEVDLVSHLRQEGFELEEMSKDTLLELVC